MLLSKARSKLKSFAGQTRSTDPIPPKHEAKEVFPNGEEIVEEIEESKLTWKETFDLLGKIKIPPRIRIQMKSKEQQCAKCGVGIDDAPLYLRWKEEPIVERQPKTEDVAYFCRGCKKY